jgi:WhiB family transcriptional regulator, redox-sensing transcriptional regulator
VNVITDGLTLVETTNGMPSKSLEMFGGSALGGGALEESAFDQVALRGLVLIDGAAEEPDWQENALCAQTDPEAFFPEKGGSTREAKRICAGCEVRAECLEYALAHDERFGIWGGLSERERRRLRRAVI